MLIVELDGDSHDGRQEYDEKRSACLRALGFDVIRFTNVDVFENLEGVLETILLACEAKIILTPDPSPQPSPPGNYIFDSSSVKP